MNKLHISICCFLAALSTGAGPLFAAKKWYMEAGATHLSFNKGDYGAYLAVDPIPVPYHFPFGVNDEKRKQTAPFVAVGSQLTDWLGLRLSYHFLDDITAVATGGVVIGGDAIDPRPIQIIAKVKWLTLAPELRWKIASQLALTFSPSANWISNKEIAYRIPERVMFDTRRTQSVTFGAAAGAVWTFTEHTALALSYGYTDFKPSRGREARLLSGSLRVFF